MRHPAMRPVGIFCFIALCSFLFAAQLPASALRPIMRAATSKNGRFLVVETLDLSPEGEGAGRSILGATFEVSPLETFDNNSRDRLTSPNKYYSDSWNSWKIRLPHDSSFLAPWPIISDDGETLILVGVNPPMPGVTLLAIYKRREHEGTLLRSYNVDDLWSLKPGEKRIDGMFDSTPEWFADGSFSFSPDNQLLLYTDKQHGLTRLSLKTGEPVRNE
jgi:hypothetical protein